MTLQARESNPGQVVEATLPLHMWNVVTLFHVWPSYHWLHWFSSSYLWLYLSVSCFQEQCSWESSFWPLPCSFLVDSSKNYQFLPKLSQLLLKTEIYLLAAAPKGLHQSYTIYWPDKEIYCRGKITKSSKSMSKKLTPYFRLRLRECLGHYRVWN